MAFISNKPKFLSSNSADLNFCQGYVSFLLVFKQISFILSSFGHSFIVLISFVSYELDKDLLILYYFLVLTALVGKRCINRAKTAHFIMEHILIYKHLLNTRLSGFVIDPLHSFIVLCTLISILQIKKLRLREVK